MVKIQLEGRNQEVTLNAMIDSGATEDFIDQGLCDKYEIPTRETKKPREVYLADGQPSDIGPITHTAETTMTIGSHQEYATFQAANLEHHEAILGIPWLRKHNPRINWANGQITFDSNLCINRCLERSPTVETVPEAQAEEENLAVRFAATQKNNASEKDRTTTDQRIKVKKMTPEARIPTKGTRLAAGHDLYATTKTTIPIGGQGIIPTGIAIQLPKGTYGRIAPRSGLATKHRINTNAGVIDSDYTGEVQVVLVNQGNQDFTIHRGDKIAQLIVEKISTQEWEQVQELIPTTRGSRGFGSTDSDEKEILIREISAQAFGKMYLRGERTAILKRIGTSLKAINISTELAIRKHKNEGPAKELRDIVPRRYHRYLSLFEEAESTKLTTRKPGTDHEIELELDKPGAKLPNPTLYSIGEKEIKALNKYIDQNLDRGWIRPSKSAVGAGILMVPKKDGSIRICIDY